MQILTKLLFPYGHDLFGIYRKNLLYNIVGRNLKLKYRQSYMGMLWTLLIPAFSAIIYYFVFQIIMKVQIPNYLLFVLSGLVPWTFLSGTALGAMESIVLHGYLINKVPVPPSIFPLTETITGFINFLLAIPILFIVAFITQAPINFSVFYLPLLFALLFVQTYSISLALGTLFVYFRDLRHLMTLILQVWFYLTPVIYSESMIPENFKWISKANPSAYLFSGIHNIFVFGQGPTPEMLLISCLWTFGLLMLSFWIYKKISTFIAENI